MRVESGGMERGAGSEGGSAGSGAGGLHLARVFNRHRRLSGRPNASTVHKQIMWIHMSLFFFHYVHMDLMI